jgi:hypothetical protein
MLDMATLHTIKSLVCLIGLLPSCELLGRRLRRWDRMAR